MNLLDENFPLDQRPLLRDWRIPVRQIGRDVAASGAQDADIIPLLHRLGRVTFFTQDEDFFDVSLCHLAYGLVFLDVRADDVAEYVRRFLAHPRFKTKANRMGIVARVHHEGVAFWQRNRLRLQRVGWSDGRCERQ